MNKLLILLIAILIPLTGCEKTKEVAKVAQNSAVTASKFVKKRVPIVREILEAVILAYDAVKEWNSGASWKTSVANAIGEFFGSDSQNELESKLENMTDHQVNEFYEKNKRLLDPLIEEHAETIAN